MTTSGRRRARMPNGTEVATGVAVILLGAVDVVAASNRHPAWPVVVFFAATLVVAVVPLFGRWPATLPLRLGVPVAVSLAVTGTAPLTGWGAFGPAETVVLLLVFVAAVRGLRPVVAAATATVTAVAVVAVPWREAAYGGGGDSTGALTGITVVVVVVLAGSLTAAMYLRTLDARRRDAVVRTRVAERADMAAELHDFVAHHVTGILAEARMGRMLLDRDPAAVAAALDRIETSAVDALNSMRQTVHLLRTADDRADGTAPTDTTDLAALPELLERSGMDVTLAQDVGVTDALPMSLQAATFRVVREAVTNVRKHAGRGGRVEVTLEIVERRLVVTVHNDAGSGTHVDPGQSGYGLIGLTERVEALGGTLDYGPDGADGWTVIARLPLAATSLRPSGR